MTLGDCWPTRKTGRWGETPLNKKYVVVFRLRKAGPGGGSDQDGIKEKKEEDGYKKKGCF